MSSNTSSLSATSLDTSQPFTRAEALVAGLTDVDLRSRRFQRLFHGLYIRSGSKIGVHQMAAAALHISPPGSFASHETAAALWGASVGNSTKSTSAFRGARRGPSGVASLPIELQRTKARGHIEGCWSRIPRAYFLTSRPPARIWSTLWLLVIPWFATGAPAQRHWWRPRRAIPAKAHGSPGEQRPTSVRESTRQPSRGFGC